MAWHDRHHDETETSLSRVYGHCHECPSRPTDEEWNDDRDANLTVRSYKPIQMHRGWLRWCCGIPVSAHRDDIYGLRNNPSSQMKLLDYKQPSSNIFRSRAENRAQSTSMPAPILTGGATPMPDSYSSSTPAWDPSSRTPTSHSHSFDFDLPSTAASSSTAATSSTTTTSSTVAISSSPLHPFLDKRLTGKSLKATVNGHGHTNKDMVVTVVETEGELSICYTHYNRTHFLQPATVTAKHPNPLRDNGLLVVISGEHCGKLVRRIHHRYVEGHALVNLAVVEQVDDAADNILPERLELSPDLLCIGSETKKKKDLNSSLMGSLRRPTRH